MKLANLKLNPDNPRNIKPEKLEKLAQSIKDFPKMMVKRPIVYDENKIIIGGNMRYKAIEKLGMTEIPDEWTSDASDFTPEERKRFIMQDNAEMGEHDWDMVANQYELEDLDAWGIDVPYADTEAEVEEDEAPEVSSEPPVSQLGSIYQLGRHRVMCGDSTDFDQVDTLLDGKRAEMCFTDPPYGVNYDGGHFHSGDVNIKRKREKLAQDDSTQIYSDVVPVIAKYTDGPVYTFYADTKPTDLYVAVEAVGEIHALLIWHKTNATYAAMNAQYKQRHEPFLYWKPKGSTLRWCGATTEATIWELTKDGKNDMHPTQKPVHLAAKAIQNHEADTVLDLFLGSGSTLIACEQTDRICYGMELDPKYVDVIRKRYWKFVNDGDEKGWEDATARVN